MSHYLRLQDKYLLSAPNIWTEITFMFSALSTWNSLDREFKLMNPTFLGQFKAVLWKMSPLLTVVLRLGYFILVLVLLFVVLQITITFTVS